jgi:hypothetical protein
VALYFPGGMKMHVVRDIGLFSIFAMLGVGHPLDRARQDCLHARLLGRRRRGRSEAVSGPEADSLPPHVSLRCLSMPIADCRLGPYPPTPAL